MGLNFIVRMDQGMFIKGNAVYLCAYLVCPAGCKNTVHVFTGRKEKKGGEQN
jgi:hypothetical protein